MLSSIVGDAPLATISPREIRPTRKASAHLAVQYHDATQVSDRPSAPMYHGERASLRARRRQPRADYCGGDVITPHTSASAAEEEEVEVVAEEVEVEPMTAEQALAAAARG